MMRKLQSLIFVALLCQGLYAEDCFLTFGGGYSPQGNQVSLEKNVQYFRRVLKALGKEQSPQHYLFADGDDPGRDLQYQNPAHNPPKVNQLLAAVFDQYDGLYDSYRSNGLEGLEGPCTVEGVDRCISQAAGGLRHGDRLFIYFTGHGGRAENGDQNTRMHLWDHQHLKGRDLAARLDKVPAQSPVVLVMVQCYSGGFANLIFKGGDPKQELDEHPRAGFFATVHDRTAAGCTPDINEANYREYSGYFWAAVSGTSRLGQKIEKPDYDGDGRTSLVEAHAYALIESDSIDVSVKTSEALLRKYSTLKAPPDQPSAGWLTFESDIEAVLASAGPAEKAVIARLSQKLNLTGSQRLAEADALARKIEGQRHQLSEEHKKLEEQAKAARKAVADRVKTRWPELENPWHPSVPQTLKRESRPIIAAIENHPQFHRLRELGERMDQIEDQRLELERQWAKAMRLTRTIENVLYAHNLPRTAAPQVIRKYAELTQLENGSF